MMDPRRRIPQLVLYASALLAARQVAAQPIVEIVADALDPQACGGTGCWTNHLRVADIDGNGSLDIVLANYADFFNGSESPQPLVVYSNNGTGTFTNVSDTAVGSFSGNIRQMALGDVDGDGDPDIYAPDGAGLAPALFINDGSGVFANEAATRLPTTDYPQAGATRLGDLDGDGDLDIFAADGYGSEGPPFGHVYLNDGTGVFSEAVGAIPDAISGTDIDDVELADVDRDFDLDLVVNAHGGGIGALWLNDGSGTFSAGGTLAAPATGNFHYNVTPCDVDGDGDLDLWIDNIGGDFTEQLQINDGHGNFTDETSTRVAGNPGLDDNGVICADMDDDGDLDAIVLSLAGPERLLENDGTGQFTYVPGSFPGAPDCTLWGELGDLDGDGRLDLVTGQGECSSSDEVYLGTLQQPVDETPPKIIAIDAPASALVNSEAVVRFAVSDRTITDDGPRLRRAFARLDPDGAAFEVDAHFVGGDLFRVSFLPYAAGPLQVAVCAEDRQTNLACAEPVIIEVGSTADGGPMGDDGGCACTANAGDGGWLLALVVVASWFRRRSTRQVAPKPMSA